MLSRKALFLSALGLGSAMAATIPMAVRGTTPNFAGRNTNTVLPSTPGTLVRRSCGETAPLVCYGVGGGTSQGLDLDDIAYTAGYLRYLADTAGDNPLWTMPPEFDCSEWSLPVFGAGTVLALAKHINPRTNSSVTYYDLARTIDGGADATEEQIAASLMGACGKNGGQVHVTVDQSDPVYSSPSYVAGKSKPKDIIIKLVRDPAST